MDKEDLYDEFGNFIGDLNETVKTDLPTEEAQQSVLEDDEELELPFDDDDEEEDTTALVTKQYGTDVEVLVETENIQSFDEPLVKPQESNVSKPEHVLFTKGRRNIPKATLDRDYMLSLLQIPERIRNVAVIGPLHSGKTSLTDLFVYESHRRLNCVSKSVEQGWKQLKYMDALKQEIERGVSIKLNGFTFLAEDLNDKSLVVNLLDAPGHVNFMDEVAVSLDACDIAMICIDVVEGVTAVVEQLIKQCERRKMDIIFVINKIDRLILEFKISPHDCYLKLLHLVTKLNTFTKSRYSPELNNVAFASSLLGFSFTMAQFAKQHYIDKIAVSRRKQFTKALWTQYFESFVLEPIYKIVTHTLSTNDLDILVSKLKPIMPLPPKIPENFTDPLPLLKYVFQTFMGKRQLGIHSALQQCSSPTYLKSPNTIAHILKTLDYGGDEYCLVKIISGQLVTGSEIFVVDSDSDIIDDNADKEVAIDTVSILGGRYVLECERAYPGQIVLVKGISHQIEKSGTLFSSKQSLSDHHELFLPKIDYINIPSFKMVLEPLNSKDLPRLMDALNKINKYYPGVLIKIEESGENVIIGSGELYMDCLLYDLRINYAKMEIKISDPMTIFRESCASESFAAIPITMSNDKITISIGAEPLDLNFIKDVGQGKLDPALFEKESNVRELSKLLRKNYGWDSLAARNVWFFYNTNVFIDDTIPDETDRDLLNNFKEQIKQGFYWAVKEGPLCEENIFGVQFKLLSFTVNGSLDDADMVQTVGNQLIPMIRKACYIALLTAKPCLLEPVYQVDIVVNRELQIVVDELFAKRRGGRIYRTLPIGGTPFLEVRGQLPVIESFGFETDLRLATRGQAMCQLQFWNEIWRRVPGDVMNSDAVIPKLKPAPRESLSRDFVMKTRRRKGLSNDGFVSDTDGPSLSKYIDRGLFEQLQGNGLV
ncbi:U5 snRNP GTPase SNU114 KNAG_0C00990 [Huiozyma naganishii CBS 8797]|uniref:Tr-type G domain-containing protein n=1 Tax=Huiozyma naganishii (strain ATCC MYA-139 / BCRC 22969 / CBS 8797 / KCTC 17520 / NBRC 10181 / NCYC 3082 / Yp74L-3) TaxID=1071383 RepID=J7RW53_HUIN7|nr:hypothetical protein KNAG_0C00990 [Kazachstania naganishii CBS 8797]CCK69212.1 hypothetical protein KNAG_0C00990 [Kazachstania naganishii CBS 8797]